MTTEDKMKETAQELEKMLASKSVLGQPIVIGEKTLIPISVYGFGFGFGGGHGEKGGGEGSGGGGAVVPVALVIVHGDVSGPEGIQVLSITKGATVQAVETLVESIAPKVIEAIKAISKTKEEKDDLKTVN